MTGNDRHGPLHDDWSEVTKPGNLATDQTHALRDQYWPCTSVRSKHHRYHRAEPVGCRDPVIRWNQNHRKAMRGQSWQWWLRCIIPRQWITWRWMP